MNSIYNKITSAKKSGEDNDELNLVYSSYCSSMSAANDIKSLSHNI